MSNTKRVRIIPSEFVRNHIVVHNQHRRHMADFFRAPCPAGAARNLCWGCAWGYCCFFARGGGGGGVGVNLSRIVFCCFKKVSNVECFNIDLLQTCMCQQLDLFLQIECSHLRSQSKYCFCKIMTPVITIRLFSNLGTCYLKLARFYFYVMFQNEFINKLGLLFHQNWMTPLNFGRLC